MNYRDGIRPRPIDDHKSYFIIKDLKKAKLNSNKEGRIELCIIEKELYKVLEHYDKRKKIQIPKAKIICQKNDKKHKNENIISYNINNNIIYTNENNDNSSQNNSAYILNYKLKEYKRPDNYIIYSSSDKNEINSKKKLYEAKEADIIFLNIRNNFMRIEELENIIIDLEANSTSEKYEKINEENARKIIQTKYSKYIHYIDSIINHFKDRRNTTKKSLIRKKWHLNKSSDKYITNTFRKREKDKIKIRKNTHNKEESINKIIDSKKFCKNYILPIMNDMEKKEFNKKNLLKLEEYIFQSECDKIKKLKIPQNRIKENNIIKEDIEKRLKLFKEKEFNYKKSGINENKQNKEHIINNKITNYINGTNLNNKIFKYKEVNKNKSFNINEQFYMRNKQINEFKRNNVNGSKIISGNELNPNKRMIGKKIVNKNNLINKNNKTPPILSSNSLNNSNSKNKNFNTIKNSINNLRLRIRLNRNNKITVDRYIQNNNDFNPFNDSYNEVMNNYKKYDNNSYNNLDNKNFENLLNSYNLEKAKNLNILYESDDDSIESTNDIKHFSNSYKQFLKLKKEQIHK